MELQYNTKNQKREKSMKKRGEEITAKIDSWRSKTTELVKNRTRLTKNSNKEERMHHALASESNKSKESYEWEICTFSSSDEWSNASSFISVNSSVLNDENISFPDSEEIDSTKEEHQGVTIKQAHENKGEGSKIETKEEENEENDDDGDDNDNGDDKDEKEERKSNSMEEKEKEKEDAEEATLIDPLQSMTDSPKEPACQMPLLTLPSVLGTSMNISKETTGVPWSSPLHSCLSPVLTTEEKRASDITEANKNNEEASLKNRSKNDEIENEKELRIKEEFIESLGKLIRNAMILGSQVVESKKNKRMHKEMISEIENIKNTVLDGMSIELKGIRTDNKMNIGELIVENKRERRNKIKYIKRVRDLLKIETMEMNKELSQINMCIKKIEDQLRRQTDEITIRSTAERQSSQAMRRKLLAEKMMKTHELYRVKSEIEKLEEELIIQLEKYKRECEETARTSKHLEDLERKVKQEEQILDRKKKMLRHLWKELVGEKKTNGERTRRTSLESQSPDSDFELRSMMFNNKGKEEKRKISNKQKRIMWLNQLRTVVLQDYTQKVEQRRRKFQEKKRELKRREKKLEVKEEEFQISLEKERIRNVQPVTITSSSPTSSSSETKRDVDVSVKKELLQKAKTRQKKLIWINTTLPWEYEHLNRFLRRKLFPKLDFYKIRMTRDGAMVIAQRDDIDYIDHSVPIPSLSNLYFLIQDLCADKEVKYVRPMILLEVTGILPTVTDQEIIEAVVEHFSIEMVLDIAISRYSLSKGNDDTAFVRLPAGTVKKNLKGTMNIGYMQVKFRSWKYISYYTVR